MDNDIFDITKVLFPPVGIAHITRDISDLVTDSLYKRSGFELSCSMQPNSAPHIGSITTLMTAFAISKHLFEVLKVEGIVTFDQLENAPAKTETFNGIPYVLSLSDYHENGMSLANKNMRHYGELLDFVSEKSGIPYRIRSYLGLQSNYSFRKNLLLIISNPDRFRYLFSPSDGTLRIRFPCKICKRMDKNVKKTTLISATSQEAVFSFECPIHGTQTVSISTSNDEFIDTNTPIRSVLKACAMIYENETRNFASLINNGGDWSGQWLQRIYINGLDRLNYKVSDMPPQFFTPMITDWSGAKLSKSQYVQSKAYNYLPQGFVNISEISKDLVEPFLNVLWDEVNKWVKEPSRFFRNYSVTYFKQLLEANGVFM